MNTETRIQQASIRLLLAYGYDKTSMEDIANEAGVARSTIYTKWKSKEDLFSALLWQEALSFAREWYRLVEADPKGGSFSGIYKNSLLAIRHNPFIQALYTQNRRILGSFISYDQFSRLMNDRLVWTTTLFEMMQAEGLIRADVDAKTAAQMAVAFRQGLLLEDLEPPGSGYEDVIDLFTAMFRDYLELENPGEKGKEMLKAYVEKLQEQYEGFRLQGQ